MIGNVQILKNNGDSLVSNGLAHFILNSSQKQYIIYTLGEQSGNNLKAYIGLENAPVTDEGITKEEGEILYNLLKSIGKNEDISSLVTFLPLTAGLYHIHDVVKKVAVPPIIINKAIDLQQQSQIKATQEDVPVIKENTFFDQSTIEQPHKEVAQVAESSIFSQPMQPIIESTELDGKNDSELVKNDENIEATTDKVEENSIIGEEMVTDEQAKKAIKTVEEAQKTISENVKIIKRYISQQKALANNSTTTALQSNETLELENDVSETKKEDLISDSAAMKDVVNDIELAPQPVASLDVLGEETDLRVDNGLEPSDQIIQENNDGGFAVTEAVNESGIVDLNSPATMIQEQQDESSALNLNMQQEQNDGSVKYIDTTSMSQGDTSYDQQMSGIADEYSANQFNGAPSYIDTTAMVHQPQAFENQYLGQDMDPSQKSVIDTGIGMETQNFEKLNEGTTLEPVNLDLNFAGQAPKAAEATSEISYDQGQQSSHNESIAEKSNFGFSTQMPSLEIQNMPTQFDAADNNFGQEEQKYIPNNIPQPGYSENIIQYPTSEPPMENDYGEGNIPPLGEANDNQPLPDVAPVILPDGQVQGVDQGLVLTPEAFTLAA